MEARFGSCMLALAASVCWARSVRAAPREPGPADSAPREGIGSAAPDSTRSAATGHSAEVVLVGAVGENAELGELVEELLAAVAIAPHLSRMASVRRGELLYQAARPSSGQARVWVTLSGPNVALLLFAGPSGRRYLVRQVPLRSGLDELGRERIAQVLQSSLLTLLRGGAGLTVEQMRVAVETSEKEAAPRRPSGTSPPEAPVPEPAVEQTPARLPLASVRWGLGYAAAWTGQALRTRHGPTLRVGLDAIGGTPLHVGLALERDFDQTYRTPQVGVRTQTTSGRLMLGGQWHLGGGLDLYARAGAGLDVTRVEPTPARERTVRLRDALTDFTAVSRAELGVSLEAGPFVVDMGPRLDVSLADSHYDLAYDGQPRRVATVWPALPGLELSGAWRPWGPRKPSSDDSGARSGSAMASHDTDSP